MSGMSLKTICIQRFWFAWRLGTIQIWVVVVVAAAAAAAAVVIVVLGSWDGCAVSSWNSVSVSTSGSRNYSIEMNK